MSSNSNFVSYNFFSFILKRIPLSSISNILLFNKFLSFYIFIDVFYLLLSKKSTSFLKNITLLFLKKIHFFKWYLHYVSMNSFLFLKENISIIPIMYYNKLLHMYFYNFFLKNTLQHLNLDTTNYFYNMWVLFLSYFFKYKTNFKTVKSFVCINKFIYNMYFNTNYFFYFYYNRSNMLYKKHIFDLLEFTNNYKDRISYFHNNHFFYLSYLKFYLYGININLFISILFLLIFWFYFSDFFKDMLEIEFSLYGNYKKEVFKYHKYNKYRL